jgi:fibronectin type 3 domain-containing protein
MMRKTKQGWSWIALMIAVTMVLSTVAASAAAPKLIAAFFVKGKVGLKWQKAEGVEEYGVYRKSSDGEYAKITTVDDDHYFDTDVSPGTAYVYKIGITDAGGAELFSAEKSVTIPGASAGDFTPPTWVGVRMDRDKIFLNWDPVPGAMAYNIHRSTTPGVEYEIVGNAQASKFVDKDGLEKGTTYYYVLSALNSEFEETEVSEERSIKYGLSLEEFQALEAEQNKIELEPVTLTKLFEITQAGSYGDMNQPADVFVNSKGDIYVTDALNNCVHCFGGEGKYKFSFGEEMNRSDADDPPPGTFQVPFTLFIDKQDQVYVSDIDARDIQVFTADGKFVRRIRVETGEGMEKFKAAGMHVLDDGRIVCTDTGNHRFLIIDNDGNILLSKGERGDEPGQFNFPDELVVTADNTVCIVDIINCRVQEFDLEGNFVRQFGEVGQTAGTFARPKAISIDENGRLWVADAMSNMIQSFTVEGAVKSALGTSEDGHQFITPRGMYFKDGRFYLVNRVPHKVLVYKIG